MTARPHSGRIGILGGTLDPVHVGHLETARAAQQALELARIILLPARIPPHRSQGPSASTFHRFAMAALAVSDLDTFRVSDDELQSEQPSFTAVTLERLGARGFHPSQIFFITGADAFAEIETWYRYPDVLRLAHFVVISRPGVPVSTLGDRLPALAGRLTPVTSGGAASPQPSVFLLDARTPDVSSTDIRRRVRAGDSIRGMVPASVEAHIRRHGLYAESRTADHLQ